MKTIIGSELLEVHSVSVESHGKLKIRFSDGIEHQVDLTELLKKQLPVFAALCNENEFKKVSVNPVGGIQWESGADLSAEFLRALGSGKIEQRIA